MLKKDNASKVLEVFFDNPAPEGIGFQLREISRMIGLAPKSVKTYLDMLKEEGLISSRNHRIHNYPVYHAARENPYFRYLKRLNTLKNIYETGLLDYLDDACMPDSIVLFGSASRGEDIYGSDIDIYLCSDSKNLDLKKFEKALNRKINILFEKNFRKISKELRNNVINGDRLKGYLRL